MYDMPLVQKCLGPVLVKQSVNGLMTVSDNRRISNHLSIPTPDLAFT